MKQLRPYPQAVITKKGAHFINSGHVWVYDAEVCEVRPSPLDGREVENGDVVDVVDGSGTYLGTGLISLLSTIRIRIVSRNANDRFDEAFWERKLRWAWQYRVAAMGPCTLPGCEPDTDCCRLIFSEADAFPGLVVDRYGDVLVAEVHTVGMERLRPVLYPLLVDILRADGQDICGVYERNDAKVREKEGLPLYKDWYALPGEERTDGASRSCQRIISENGIRYAIDLEGGQKTGFYLDQKYNRRAVARLAGGRRVLDCFTHVGAFALNAARAGAAFVHGIDVSASAVEAARTNAGLNGLAEHTQFTCANIFDLLPDLVEDQGRSAGGPYDLIVLDPPAFTKNRKTVHEAARGYRQINYRAMQLLPRGGYLATCSCSHFMDEKLLSDVIREAAHDAHVQLRQVEARQQAPDHPILWGVPETNYLKFFIFQVV